MTPLLNGITGFIITEYGQSYPWPPWSTRYTMSFRQRKLVCEEITVEKEIRRFEIVFPEGNWPAILEAVNKCNFLAWDEEYDSEPVLDAVYWELTLQMSGNRAKHSAGNITRPKEWNLVMDLFRDCKDLAEFIKGNVKFRILPWNEYYRKRHNANEYRVFRRGVKSTSDFEKPK